MFSMDVVPQYFRKLSHQILGLIFQAKDQHWAYEKIQIAFHYVISYFLFPGISFISPHFFNTCLLVILSFVLQSACKLLRDRNPSLLWILAVSHSEGSRSRSGSTSFTVQSHQTCQRPPLQVFSRSSGVIGTVWVNSGRADLLCSVRRGLPLRWPSKLPVQSCSDCGCCWELIHRSKWGYLVLNFVNCFLVATGLITLIWSECRGILNRLKTCRLRSMQAPRTVGPHTQLRKCHA